MKMERKTPQSQNQSQRRSTKRPFAQEFDHDIERSSKKALVPVKSEDIDEIGVEKMFKFRVLLPNGKTVEVKISGQPNGMPLLEFVNSVKQEYARILRQAESQRPRRTVNWISNDLHFVDAFDKEIHHSLNFKNFKPNKWNLLRLKDGSKESDTYENMWDITPHTDLLKELPAEYTYETALADLIDNALQAVWSNSINVRKMISVEILDDKITIFDTGPGMDGSDRNSIDKWGKMGASLHRSSRKEAIGGKAPYLIPFFGMYGYGGPIASMHLGKRAVVSSKTKDSAKVYMLHLERDALLSSSSSEHTWRTNGGLRDPSKDELLQSPHGSFTKIEIMEPKVRVADVSQLQCKLKDIYFPYIQCDEDSESGRTVRHIEFQVNGVDLAEIEGGEVASTNLHSCNGPVFTFQLYFSEVACSSAGTRAYEKANARLKCVYFPIVRGKESIESILEKLESDGCGLTESYESFSRVSIRRLGRLLPDARWQWLPFMDLRQRKGDKAQFLKRCCSRVKCFIETDAGFNPTPSKTDLAHHHPCTTALRNFGVKIPDKDKEVHIEVSKDGKSLSLQSLERKYQDWILQMHERYDEEIDCGEDEPTYVFNPPNKKELVISSDVLRIHKVLLRKGTRWRSGQKIKVFKGACTGCHKTNVYATLEYIILEGCEGDAGGEARIVCRPIGVPDEKGCLLSFVNGNPTIEIRGSISLPISVIDSGKCIAIGDDEWNCKLEMDKQKVPSSIDLLSAEQCQEVKIGGALPYDIVHAGHKPPEEIVAVIRPAAFDSAKPLKRLNQRYIVREDYEMTLDINFEAEDKSDETGPPIYSTRVTSSSRNGVHGLYIFSLKEIPHLLEKAGVYTFLLSLKEVSCRASSNRVQVKALSEVGSWGILGNKKDVKYSSRVGSCFPPFSIACYDIYNNRIPFKSNPEVVIKFRTEKGVLIRACDLNLSLSQNKMTMEIRDVRVESSDLDKIRPKYEVFLLICSQDESFSVQIPCQVFPGALERCKFHPPVFGKQLLPGHTIKELELEMFDAYGNHLKKNEDIQLHVDGFHFQDKRGPKRKVDDHGNVNLDGILKVSKGYGGSAMLSVLHGDKLICTEEYQIEKRELRTAFEVPIYCAAGSKLENLVFEVTSSEGEVDETIHDKDEFGNSHTLTIRSETLDIDDSLQYAFRHGLCTVRSVTLPNEEGVFSFLAAHSSYPELHLSIKVHIEEAVNMGYGNSASQGSNGNALFLQELPALMYPKQGDEDVNHEISDGKLTLIPSSPHYQDVVKLIDSLVNEQKELEDDVCNYGSSIGKQEKDIEILEFNQSKLEKELSRFQASLGHDFCDNMYTYQRKIILEKIVSKSNSAAAVVCKFLESPLSEKRHRDFAENILGVVALLGSVQSDELSRIFTQYLGEDQMLAVVCRTSSSARAFEKYELNGHVHAGSAFYELATKFGYTVSGRYLVICLEDLRPYAGRLGRDPERKLALLDPTLPDGRSPRGFLGYAVNMIGLDRNSLQCRTASGHGLRETLFYCLFGELQVYETREYMNMAKSCIKEGAVSLDGGIMRGSGVKSFGYCELDIQFPVVSIPKNMEILKQHIEVKNMELNKVSICLEEERKILEKTKRKFYKRRDRYDKFIEEKGPLVASLLGVYRSQPAT